MPDDLSLDQTARVRFGETDAAGIVYYPSFFTWFVLGTDAILRSLDGRITAADGRPRWELPNVESGATFVAPLRYDDEITIRSSIADVKRVSFRTEHAIFRGGLLCATGFEVRVHVRRDGDRLRAETLPEDLRAALEPYRR
jgi:YbgC/YbaW family acyl-CoA thioester hydrolase